jgi:hypothetical protein
MWSRSLPTLSALLALAGCPGGHAGLGEPCDGNGACDSRLQCVASVCVPRCQRGPECGDGYACSEAGLCVLATGQAGDACASETDCAPGLACGIDGTHPDGSVVSTCTAHNNTRPAGSACATDAQCDNNTCALGTCVDLCRETRDCISGAGCTAIPLVDNAASLPTAGGTFDGCLPNHGAVVWNIPVSSPRSQFYLPVPAAARSATVVFRVSDSAQRVGAYEVREPGADEPAYTKPCDPTSPTDPTCNPALALDQFFRQPLRHQPAPGQSVLQIPTSTANPLVPGAYAITASSFRADGAAGSAIPTVTAIMKMDASVNLDLHFYFLDLTDHPCEAAFGGATLDATLAQSGAFFQNDYLGELRRIFSTGGIALNTTTYTDVRNHPELDGLARDDAGALLALGGDAAGLDVFFVRTMSPVGLQAFGPNPGPGGLPGTRESGIVISLDTLCFRTWPQLARLTAHEVARYMGLYHNVELDVVDHPLWRDQIDDSDDSSTNLMFFSENGGADLSPGQRDILTRNAVLR